MRLLASGPGSAEAEPAPDGVLADYVRRRPRDPFGGGYLAVGAAPCDLYRDVAGAQMWVLPQMSLTADIAILHSREPPRSGLCVG